MPQLALWQWLLGAFCAFMIGVAKTGMPGVGILVVPLMVLMVGNTRASAGWLLPILCTADCFAVLYWRRHAAAGKLFSLAPWVIAGMFAGAFALNLEEKIMRPMVGFIILIMLLLHLYRRYKGELHAVHGGPYGIAAGFATTVANAAGPVMNLFLLTKNLPKEEFIATGAWFFFFINLVKVPIYIYHRLFTRDSITFAFFMIPAVLTGAMAGRWLLGRISPKVFEGTVILLTALSTFLLFR